MKALIVALLILLLLLSAPRDASTTGLTCQMRQHRQKRVCWCAPGPPGALDDIPHASLPPEKMSDPAAGCLEPASRGHNPDWPTRTVVQYQRETYHAVLLRMPKARPGAPGTDYDVKT